MTWRPPFSPAEKEYAKNHLNDWPSELAYKMSVLFGVPRTERGVRNLIKTLKREQENENVCPIG